MEEVVLPVCCPNSCFDSNFIEKYEPWLYNGFANRNTDVRNQTFTSIKNKVLSWLELLKSSPQSTKQCNGSRDRHSSGKADCITTVSSIVEYHMHTLYHHAVQCPLEDVRENCTELVARIHSSGIASMEDMLTIRQRGPSSFIPLSAVVPVNSSMDKTKVLFTEAYRQNSRLDHLTQIMGFHPQYLACFLRTQNRLLRADGPLPYTHRHYIAIIAAARHQCTYLIHLHTAEYLQAGGDRSWLESLDNVPMKWRNLQEINRLLAHRPWLVTSKTIESLCRCGSNSWSLSELTHAIVLLAHFHALCSAVFGCGVNFELDDAAGRLVHSDGESSSDSDNDTMTCEQAAVDGLLDRLKKLKDEAEEYSEEEGKRRFVESIETQTAECGIQHGKLPKTNGSSAANAKNTNTSNCVKPATSPSSSSPPTSAVVASSSSMSHLIDHSDFVYVDFIKFKDTTQTFRASDYSWESHGFSIANRFYTDIGEVLDEKFRIAKEFTYYTMGDKYTNVNTQDFRTGIWNYIHSILGIRHDDYDYGRVNSLLERGLKSFIKLMTCYPERVSKKDFESSMKGFTYSEKIHVNIILIEARMQAELMYALRAVAQFMT